MRISLLAAALAICTTGVLSAQGTAPSLTRVRIASGSFNTAERVVRLELTASGSPTAYRASEKRDLAGAVWRTFTATPSFTLSSEPGWKTVYVQVGRAPTISSDLSRTGSTTLTQPIDFVPTPTLLSTILADTIVLGLPDLRSSVVMPASVRNNQSFDFTVKVTNAGQSTPPGEIIRVYNSFVTNTIQISLFGVNWGTRSLVGDGCVPTSIDTLECTLAPMIPGGVVAIEVKASVVNGIPKDATEVSHTLRTRITGIRESDIANNWRDTKITIVK